VDGRAVLVNDYNYADGEPEPRVWLCRIGRWYLCCDNADINPAGRDESFVRRFSGQQTVADTMRAWRMWRLNILARRRKARRRPSRSRYATSA